MFWENTVDSINYVNSYLLNFNFRIQEFETPKLKNSRI